MSGFFYAKGLSRVCGLIESIGNYDEILGERRLNRKYIRKILSHMAQGEYSLAAEEMKNVVLKSNVFQYEFSGDLALLSYASTYNNRKQISFFEDGVKRFYPCKINNIFDAKGDVIGKVSDFYLDFIDKELFVFLKSNKILSASSILQIINYTVSYCNFYNAIHNKKGIKLIILANDHSPLPVAISMVSEAIGIKTLYLQHAAITDNFPPLDFDYSILMDARSLDIYKKIGIKRGKAYVMPREIPSLVTERNFENLNDKSSSFDAVLYLTSIFNENSLSKAVEKLKMNERINNVYVKYHPSTKKLKNSTDFLVLDKILDEFHIAIVGNSSIALELIYKGNFVYNLFELDNIGADYYGFCRQGLTKKVFLNDLDCDFWAREDSCAPIVEYLKNNFDPGCNDSLFVTYDKRDLFFKKLIIELLGINGCYSGKLGNLFFIILFYPETSFNYFRVNSSSNYEIILSLNHYFNERYIDFEYFYKYVDINNCKSVLDFWFISKMIEWSAFKIEYSSLNLLCAYVFNYTADIKSAKWMESKLFDILLRLGCVDFLSYFLKNKKYFDIWNAPVNKKISLINFKNKKSIAFDYYVENDVLSNLELLKVNVQCELKDENGEYLYKSYNEVESDYLNFCHDNVRYEYLKYVIPFYNKLKKLCRDFYIDVKRNNEAREILIAKIVYSLLNKKPFSIVRLSDGEGYLFSKSEFSLFTEEDCNNRERHWWGKHITKKQKDYIIKAGLEAVKEADVIGVPSIYRLLRDTGAKTTSLISTIQGRGLVTILRSLDGIIDISQKEFGDDKLNLSVFNNYFYIERIIENADRIIVITGADANKVIDFFSSYNRKPSVFNIPTHNKTSINNDFYFGKDILPDVIVDLNSKLKELCGPGDLVIVGGGVAGKSFIGTARKNGSVALDFGSAMDEMVEAGIHSLY